MKALALLSGGLDSILATKLILDQGIEVVAVKFILPVTSEKRDYAEEIAKKFGISLIQAEVGEEYLDVIRNPTYGYGSGMNPCIDCRIYMLREAKRIAKEVGAKFIVTGDVLGERPMSQHRKALELEEKEAGLENMILRPLSAKLLPETIPEREGWVDRSKLLAIRGRSRKPQIALAEKFGLHEDYPSPSGGCLLTYKEFASKVRDLFEHKEEATKRDVSLLKIGRHFRVASSKIIVGRNEEENKLLLELTKPLQGLRGRGAEPHSPEDYVFEVPGFGSPITILEGPKSKEAIELAAKLTARYSDAGAKEKAIQVEYGNGEKKARIIVSPLDENEVARLRI
ncbi:MAG: asparagine synthase-related protein [archaeon]|nr:asparagine synthase-related protein [archaeon]